MSDLNLWIMDTDYLSQLQRGDQRILAHLAQIKPPSIGITIITVEEQIRGRLAKIRQVETMKNRQEMILAYQNLEVTVEDFKNYPIFDFTSDANHYYTELLQQKLKIGRQDQKIAAITISVNGILLTRNDRDFSQISNLNIEKF